MICLTRFRVEGASMEPTFSSGQTLLVSSIPYVFTTPKRGDVVVVRDPRGKKLLLKRIYKKEGNKFFVTGDNPKASTDSRTFGLVTKEMIAGKVIYKIP